MTKRNENASKVNNSSLTRTSTHETGRIYLLDAAEWEKSDILSQVKTLLPLLVDREIPLVILINYHVGHTLYGDESSVIGDIAIKGGVL